jgi:two-component system, NarL family, nitrate/nitrite response regulator NarL
VLDGHAEAAPLPRVGPRSSCGPFDASRTVVVVSDVRLVRDALAIRLSREAGLKVIGTANIGDVDIRAAIQAKPNVALIDMSRIENAAAARAILLAEPEIRMVAFAIDEVDANVLACAQSGMVGYVGRDGSVSDLVDAIEHALRGELRCSPRIAAMLFGQVAAQVKTVENPDWTVLTAREQDIARLLERGLANKMIATQLGLGVATVKNHVHSILSKLQVRGRGEAVAKLRGVS